MKYPKCRYCGCNVQKMHKHSHYFECGTTHITYQAFPNDHWTQSGQCEIIERLVMKIERQKANEDSFFAVIDELKENQPLYRDSGLWQVRSDDMEECLMQQGTNESFTQFVFRVHKEQQERNDGIA